MLNLLITDGEKGELHIDYQEESVGFVVLTESKTQYNFNINTDEWILLKDFLDLQIKLAEINNTVSDKKIKTKGEINVK